MNQINMTCKNKSFNKTISIVPSNFVGEELSSFNIVGETEKCKRIIAIGNHVFVGISPFNSRFSKHYIYSLISWALTHFNKVDILMPSENDASRLLIASGYTKEKALRKTRKELRRHYKNIDEILQSDECKNRSIRIVNFSDYSDSNVYLSLKKEIEYAFLNNSEFRSSCINMSREAVMGRLKGTGRSKNEFIEKNIQLALPYIFSELPFYLNTPSIIGESTSTLIYHRSWPIGKGLFSGIYSLKINKNQSYGIVTLI